MISVDELVEYCKADEADYDRIEALRDAAVAFINEPGGTYFGPTAEITEDVIWRGGAFALGNEPTGGEITVTMHDGTSAFAAVDVTGFVVQGRLVYGYGLSAPQLGTARHLKVTYTAGYAEAFDGSIAAPEDVRQAVRMLVNHWYKHPEAVGDTTDEVAFAVSAILRKYR